MKDTLQLGSLEPVARASVADQVFEALHRKVRSLELPPGAKLSEGEVARSLSVSRQPVRDAFYRLSQLGFLMIRPQRATTVSHISARDVMRARFIRTAIEVEIIRKACERLDSADLGALTENLRQQQVAVDARDKTLFHALDDGFHEEICERSGVGFAWDVIRENKAHTDRVRYLSLNFASQTAHDDHLAILAALGRRDADAAAAATRAHLSRIEGIVEKLQKENHEWFAEET